VLFDFTPEQYGFRDAVRDLLARKMTAAHLRGAWESGQAYESDIWPSLVSLGLTGLLVPTESGGEGGSLIDLAMPLEEFGYRCLPEPVVETLVVVPSVIAHYGSSDMASSWLDRLTAGRSQAGAILSRGSLVPEGARADVVLVRDGTDLHLVPRDLITSRPVEAMDPTRRLAECAFTLGPDTLLTRDPAAATHAYDLGAAATASLLVGISQYLLDTTRDYLLEREQFGVRIGTFQALKHRLADVAVATEAARSLCWYAAYSLSIRDEAESVAASLAKGAASHAAHLANSAALQLHGGIGFTWEHDLHLWLQRGQALEAAFGSTADHRISVADHALARSASLSPTIT
jgi:alkylation response protein AidB-like acyl-CoA dehydrogenase